MSATNPPAETSPETPLQGDRHFAEIIAAREGIPLEARAAFLRRCQRFLLAQRLRRLEPYFIFGVTALLSGPLASALSLMATHGEGEIGGRRLIACAAASLVSVGAAVMVGRLAWLEDRRLTRRKLGEAWTDYRERARHVMAREMPDLLGEDGLEAYLDPWGRSIRR